MSEGKQVTGRPSGVTGRGRRRDDRVNKQSGGQEASRTRNCVAGMLGIAAGETVYVACLTLRSLITPLTLRFLLAAQIPVLAILVGKKKKEAVTWAFFVFGH